MIAQSDSSLDTTAHPYTPTKTPHQTSASQLKIVSFNIWDLPYWFVKNRQQRILQIADYLQLTGCQVSRVCKNLLTYGIADYCMSVWGMERYYASGGFEETRKVPFAVFDTTGGLVIFRYFPIMQYQFTPFHHFTPSVVERIGRKGVMEATIETPHGIMQVFNIHLHVGNHFFAHKIRVKQLKSVLERMQIQPHLPSILAGDFNENALMEQKKFVTMLQSRGLVHSLHFEPL